MRTTALNLESFGEAEAPAPVRAPRPAPRRAADPKPAPPPPPSPPAEALDTLLARARGEGRAAGFEEGVAHAETQGRAELRVLLGDLREQLADAVHALTARHEQTARAVRATSEALLLGVAPTLARFGLAAEIAEAAAHALRSPGLSEGGLTVRVAPSQADATRAALAGAGISAPVVADPDLPDLRARLAWADGEDDLDLGAAIAAAQAVIDRHLTAPERRTAHG